jgi:flavin-dependent dehydrogenase
MVGIALVFAADNPAADRDSLLTVEAVKEGWWYAALLNSGRLVAVYMSDADLISARRMQSVGQWMEALSETHIIGERILSYKYRVAEQALVLNSSSSMCSMAGGAWLSIGDAAATYDPLSSYGITGALNSGMRAAQAILAARQRALEEYKLRMQDTYADYLARRAAYYRMERRWPNSVFWRRRHALPGKLRISDDGHRH